MQTSSFNSLTISTLPFSDAKSRRKMGFLKRKNPSHSIFALKRDAYDKDHNGRRVDENMIVLRKRIHEIKMAETKEEPPADWMEWEKQYYNSYDSDICEGVGYLQSFLMGTRPSLGLGLVALVIFSVPTAMVAVVFHLMNIVKGL